jgi:hypothetical protein
LAGLCKLNAIEVLKIRELKKYLSYSQLMEVFNISMGTVQGIVERKIWRHI